MSNLTELIEQIQALPPAQQAQLREYVAFLQWQAQQQEPAAPQQWSYSLIEAFNGATVAASGDGAGMDVQLAAASVGGEQHPALWAHPPVAGQAVISYHVAIPQQVEDVRLRLSIGIRDGAEIAEDNLVAFSVRVNGVRVWGEQTNAQHWQPFEVPLDIETGDVIQLDFVTEALNAHQWTWAVWGSPELFGVLG